MPDAERTAAPTEIDLAYRRAQAGDVRGFADWVRLVEHPLRASLRSFARDVDVEAVVQEALMRMWTLAPRRDLEGPDASLRYVRTLARNLALREARRLGCSVSLDDEGASEPPAPSTPQPDPALRRAILACLQKLPARPKQAIVARIQCERAESDRDLAGRLRMRLNTFLQNVVRARRLLEQCLESRGIRLREVRQ